MKCLFFILIFIIKIEVFSEFVEIKNLEDSNQSIQYDNNSDEKLFLDVETPTFFSDNIDKVISQQEEEISKNNIDIDEDFNKDLINSSSFYPSMKKNEQHLLIKKLQYYFYTKKENNSFFNEFLQDYHIVPQTKKIHTGHLQSNELISKELIDNFEFGIGTTSKTQTSEEYWNYTPFYTTTKYNLPNDNKYLKFNFGYSFDNREVIDENKNNTIYYGIGGGIMFDNLSLDLMYQVNKDRYNQNNTYSDDSRVSLFFDYKLEN